MCVPRTIRTAKGSIIYGTEGQDGLRHHASVNCAPVTNPVYDTFVATLSNAPAGTTGYVIGSEGIPPRLIGPPWCPTITFPRNDAGLHGRCDVSYRYSACELPARRRLQRQRDSKPSILARRIPTSERRRWTLLQPLVPRSQNVYYVTTPSATLGLELLRAPTINAGTGHVSGSFATVPSANQASGDMYLVDVEDSSPTASHRLLRRFHSAANVSGTMPPDLVATVTIGATIRTFDLTVS